MVQDSSTTNSWTLTIENGNYNQQQLVQTINKKIYDVQDASDNYIFRGYYNAAGDFQANIAGADTTNKYPFPILELKYYSHNNKVKLFNYHPALSTTPTVYWYFDAIELNPCAANNDTELPRPGGKIDYNLGWLLGFRSTNIKVYSYEYATTATWANNNGSVTGQSRTPPEGIIVPSAAYGDQPITGDEIWRGFSVPKSTIDIKGPQYFMITLDDFNNNKPNKDVISLIDSVDNKMKLPSYINSQTMDSKYGKGQYYPGKTSIDGPGWACVDVADEGNNDRQCSTNDLNIDLSSNLTQAQQYAANQINYFNKPSALTTTNRYNSPNPTDYLGRFTVNRNPLDWDTSITYKNPDPKLTERKYFGPVKLVKFKVKLINDKGFAVNLEGRDWSFSLIVTHLYQY